MVDSYCVILTSAAIAAFTAAYFMQPANAASLNAIETPTQIDITTASSDSTLNVEEHKEDEYASHHDQGNHHDIQPG
ncbi:uncharacterized protein FOMMEDRAFT_152320 [Fomitiporia mediterranea MF3/22]|uniref:uncharacterized protein n=1 Tax=Fomitiporia mediterranea (strain MF3/22) TaxID=694068 RepID=UPI0004408D79|nr:uncharacterized protein FOMMEDRAFT_152320 [Fomitiporia mediterranea MF3/22]EJD06982.1 hypothetical protein FOMMEDRAFT_152320 [Fomitiporia mediterranea MF3/22]